MNPLLGMSGTKLAEAIRKREVTSRETVEAHIAHTVKVNPILNAVVQNRYDEARAEADAADRRVQSESPESLPPFHGVPCTLKEVFGFVGKPQTSGLVARKNTLAQVEAVTVTRLRAAGAIPFSFTNVPELCMWMETHNKLYGRTNNPYDATRIVGGSSGGEGALVGAGGAPFGLGSDIGGSIRMPAFFNGVFGHKPSSALIPNHGQHPLAENEALRYLCTGPIARRAEDLMPLVRAMAGAHPDDTVARDMTLPDPAGVNLAGLTVLTVVDNGVVSVQPDMQAAQRRAADHFAALGATVKTVKIEALRKSFDIWGSMLSSAGGKSFSQLMGNGEAINGPWEILKWAFRITPHTLPALLLATFEGTVKLTPKRTKRFVEMGLALREEITNLIGPNGILLYPSYSRVAPKHLAPMLLYSTHWVYTSILNVMELPVTQVPLGLNAEGLPMGVQVAAVHGNDHLTIAAAMELEKAFGGWVPPPALFEKALQPV